jgi:hemerythrin-like domain-containing protein
MNATTPIKRSQQLSPLSIEHHDGLLFIWRIRQGLNIYAHLDKIRRYTLWYWKEHIMPHFFQEEKILSPLIDKDDPMIQQMKNEHEQIRELILSLDKDADKQTFIILCDLIEKHIRYEERELFPYLEQRLNTEQLNNIHQQLKNHPVSCGEWQDVFWKK